ncbi:methyltransferase domain-containing protein [Parafilimonas sp.]|uniref:methyltransferase domain-containing protein n=1 Tax=Parafilimonas sp. TaxID=1969739 RepID=UPI0039E26C27
MHQTINLRHRSCRKELLDEDNIPFEDIQRNMQEINTINARLGGHAITIHGFKKLLGDKKSIHVCEIGCGDGNNLYQLYKWCKKNNIQFNCTGIDIKPECIEAAQKKCTIQNARWLTQDYKTVKFASKPDIIFSSLFCHHFSDEDLTAQLWFMQQNTGTGFFINDLQRNWLAYQSIKIITRFFSSSYLVKNDAPLSVARGFHKKEWIDIFNKAGIKNYTINWKWAFRYLIVFKHGK